MIHRAMALAALIGLGGCRAEPPPPTEGPRLVTPVSAEPVAAAPASAPAPRVAPTEQPLSFKGKDGTALAGSWYGASPTAPVVVLVHRLSGQRRDWSPLVGRLLSEGPEMSVLTLDLRGHGESGSPGGRVGGALQKDDVLATGDDVLAALAEVDHRLGAPATRVVGVGTDLGATALVLAAQREPRLAALALISPVAALRGVDIYAPFAAVRQRPTLLLGSKDDPVSRDPLQSMSSMVGGQITSRTLPGGAHGLPALGGEAWGEVQRWTILATVTAPAPAGSP